MLAALRTRLPVALTGLGAGVGAVWLVSQPRAAFADAPAAAASALSPEEWRAFKLLHKEQLTHGVANKTVLFRFGLEHQDQVVGLPVASCLVTRAPIGKQKEDGSRAFVIRPYTPISHPDERGHFDLAIKVYPEGKMSQHMDKLAIGDTAEFKGPIPKIPLSELQKREHVGMVAGGTGLTPMLQVAEEVLRQQLPIKLSLIFANISESDIIHKRHIDELAARHKKNLNVYYIVDKASSPNWAGGVGYITKDMLREHLPPPSDKNIVLVCGPPGMMKVISGDKAEDKSQGPLRGFLKDMGYTEFQVFKF